jgi:hypothetical protein
LDEELLPLLTDGNDEPDEELEELLELDDVPLVPDVVPVPDVPVDVVDDVAVEPVLFAATAAALEACARAATPTVPATLIAARPPVIVLTRRRPVSRSLMTSSWVHGHQVVRPT